MAEIKTNFGWPLPPDIIVNVHLQQTNSSP